MLSDPFEVARQHGYDLADLGALVFPSAATAGSTASPQLLEQIDRKARKIVDEIERVLDLVGYSRSELTHDPAIFCACNGLAWALCSSQEDRSAVSRAARISSSARLRSVISP